jgi:hypothetical protein
MTRINLDLAVKLDGSETHMLAILVDSWGDKLIIPIMADTKIEGAEYFTPCAHCGNAVLECNFEAGSDCCDRCTAGPKHVWMPTKIRLETGIVELTELDLDMHKSAILNMALTQTLPEDVMEKKSPMTIVESKIRVVVNEQLDTDERISIAIETASLAFWDVIARSFPDAPSGDYLMENIDTILLPNIKHWVDCNLPKRPEPSYRGERHQLDDLSLHYEATWHRFHTGGNCMAAVTDNVAVSAQYNYLVIADNYVCVYEDTFKMDDFMQKPIASWSFGDNPCVLMNMLDDFMGGAALWDTCKLFDDIMTLGKSGKC